MTGSKSLDIAVGSGSPPSLCHLRQSTGFGLPLLVLIRRFMQSTNPDEPILKIPVDGAVWLVCFVEADHELVSVQVFPEAQSGLSQPNVHWDIAARNFDELPEDVPTKVRSAIRQWMSKRY